MNHVAPKGINAPKASVERFAEEAAKKLGFSSGDSIEEFVKLAGGNLVVGSSGHGDDESGSVIAHDLNNWTIYVSRHTSVKRDKFTIAHEIGHLLLHLGPIKDKDPEAIMRATRWVDQNDVEQKRAEWEANWFAAGFLMPREEFMSIYSKGGVSYASMYFGVSSKAAEIRAESLGIQR
jgi:Zn-dependent peptidase ImmA (M78 family)